MNEKIMITAGFEEEVRRVKAGLCFSCKKEVNAEGFKDELSMKEFFISGLCQTCQDEVFGE